MITPELIEAVLKHSGSPYNPTDVQMQFFQAWSSGMKGSTELLIATDFSFLEVRFKGPPDATIQKIGSFANDLTVPDEMIKEMESAQKEISAKSVTAWCTLNLDSPKVDAGYMIEAPVSWDLIDMLLPDVVEKEALREHTVREGHQCIAFGSSIFPVEPERRLCFNVAGEPKKSLPKAFYFFKTLGFTKPKDAVIQSFSRCKARSLAVNVSLGPSGLVRLSMTAANPQKDFEKQLADGVGFDFNTPSMTQVCEKVGAEPSAVEYVANAKGYAVVVAWST